MNDSMQQDGPVDVSTATHIDGDPYFEFLRLARDALAGKGITIAAAATEMGMNREMAERQLNGHEPMGLDDALWMCDNVLGAALSEFLARSAPTSKRHVINGVARRPAWSIPRMDDPQRNDTDALEDRGVWLVGLVDDWTTGTQHGQREISVSLEGFRRDEEPDPETRPSLDAVVVEIESRDGLSPRLSCVTDIRRLAAALAKAADLLEEG